MNKKMIKLNNCNKIVNKMNILIKIWKKGILAHN